jgi:hypothetical protein
MNLETYWWETDPVPAVAADRPEAELDEVRQRRPRNDGITLAVIGDFRRFKASVLFKTSRAVGLYEVQPFSALSDKALADDSTQIILWSPHGEIAVSEADRARIPPGKRVINDTHMDCRKRNVQAVFEKVSGRSLGVDPLAYEGIAVVKSDRNAEHDGMLVRLPVSAARDGFVYQRLIDNVVGDSFVFDIRLPLFRGVIPLAYIKLRPREFRFDPAINHTVTLVLPSEVLNTDEIELCRAFAAEIGMEYGELDVLRDRTDGQIYIVDANNTPAGPSKVLAWPKRADALRMMAGAAAAQYFGRS